MRDNTCHILYFIMNVHPDQAEPKWNHICMTCRAFSQQPSDANEIDDIIGCKIINIPCMILVYLS